MSVCANVITIVLFMELIERDIFAALAWAAIWCILPTILNTLGMRFDLLAEIANWMPYEFLRQSITETTTIASGEALAGTWSVNVSEPTTTFLWYTSTENDDEDGGEHGVPSLDGSKVSFP